MNTQLGEECARRNGQPHTLVDLILGIGEGYSPWPTASDDVTPSRVNVRTGVTRAANGFTIQGAALADAVGIPVRSGAEALLTVPASVLRGAAYAVEGSRYPVAR